MEALRRRLLYLILGSLLVVGLLFIGLSRLSLLAKTYQGFCSKYEVWGRVADLGTDSPVEGVRVESSLGHTYTNWEGNFFLSRLSAGTPLTIQLPEGYEDFVLDQPTYQNYTQRLTCQRIVHANYFPLPGSKLTLRRLLEARVHRNYDYLWSLMVADGQKLWGSKVWTNSVMEQRDKILDKLGTFPTQYKIISDGEKLVTWDYPLTGKRYESVSKFAVELELAGGTKMTEEWYLVKEQGFWHYFPAESVALVDTFISKNWWVLSERGKE